MASTSASSVQKSSFKYDVFLSFRGEDTRKNFVDHLYLALHNKSILTYKDDERITKGKRISDELITAIQDSRFYIVVFSKKYASSSWCLDELVHIMEECHNTTSFHTAYPVFYDVEPTEVRKQSGFVGEAFSKLEKQEAAGEWREALKEAADLAGWELKNTLDGGGGDGHRTVFAEGKNDGGVGDAVVNVYINHEKKFAFVEIRTFKEASNVMKTVERPGLVLNLWENLEVVADEE